MKFLVSKNVPNWQNLVFSKPLKILLPSRRNRYFEDFGVKKIKQTIFKNVEKSSLFRGVDFGSIFQQFHVLRTYRRAAGGNEKPR